MKDKIVKIYHLFFYKLVEFTYYMNKRHYKYYELEDGLFGASGAVAILVAVFISLFFIDIKIIIGLDLWKNDIATFSIIGLGILSYIFLHHTLLSKNKWKKYEAEFKSYSRKKDRMINRIIILHIILLFTLLAASIVLW